VVTTTGSGGGVDTGVTGAAGIGSTTGFDLTGILPLGEATKGAVAAPQGSTNGRLVAAVNAGGTVALAGDLPFTGFGLLYLVLLGALLLAAGAGLTRGKNQV